MVEKPVVVWSKPAEISLRRLYQKISTDSLKNAEKVRTEIFEETRKLCNHPEIYPLDKFKKTTQETIGLLRNILIGFLIDIRRRKSEF